MESASFEVLSPLHRPAGLFARPEFVFLLGVLFAGLLASFIWAFFEHRKIKKLEKELISIHHLKRLIREKKR